MNGEGTRVRGSAGVSLTALQQPVGDLVVTEAGCEVKDGGAGAVLVLGVRQNREVLLFQNTDLKQKGHGVKLMVNVYTETLVPCWSSFVMRCSGTNELPLHQIKSGAESSSIKGESWYQRAGGVCVSLGGTEVLLMSAQCPILNHRSDN